MGELLDSNSYVMPQAATSRPVAEKARRAKRDVRDAPPLLGPLRERPSSRSAGSPINAK
jgi:hypothetical protein